MCLLNSKHIFKNFISKKHTVYQMKSYCMEAPQCYSPACQNQEVVSAAQGSVPISEEQATQCQQVAVYLAKQVLGVREYHQHRCAARKRRAVFRVAVAVLAYPRDVRVPVPGIRVRETVLECWPVVVQGLVQAVGHSGNEYKKKGDVQIPHAAKMRAHAGTGKGHSALKNSRQYNGFEAEILR